MIQAGRFGAVVLAAGAGSRFGGGKLLAPLDGRPILEHVLERSARSAWRTRVVVLGHGADDDRGVDRPGPASGGSSTRTPIDGLSSSLRVGFEALATGRPDELDGVFVVLATSRSSIRRVFRALAQAAGPRRVRIRRPRATSAAAARTRCSSCGPAGRGSPRRRATVVSDRSWPRIRSSSRRSSSVARTPTSTPPADLAELAWADAGPAGSGAGRPLPRGGRRRRLLPPGHEPLPGRPAADRRTGPRRAPRAARPDDAWLDVGAGAGRYALPLALRVREVVAVEPSEGMRTALAELAAEHEIHERPRRGERWPPPPGRLAATVARRRRADRPPRLRHRGDRPVPRRDRGGRPPAVRRRPHGASAVLDRRPVLAADPRRGAGPAAGPPEPSSTCSGRAAARRPSSGSTGRPAGSPRSTSSMGSSAASSGWPRAARRIASLPGSSVRGRGARRDLVRDTGSADDRGRELATRRRLTASTRIRRSDAASANFVDACMTRAYARRTTLRAAPGSRGRA